MLTIIWGHFNLERKMSCVILILYFARYKQTDTNHDQDWPNNFQHKRTSTGKLKLAPLISTLDILTQAIYEMANDEAYTCI